jgi:hypothetical protein
MPCGLTREALPAGLQLVGPRRGTTRLLRTRSRRSACSAFHDRAVLSPLGAPAGRGQPGRAHRPPVRLGPRLVVPPSVTSVAHLAPDDRRERRGRLPRRRQRIQETESAWVREVMARHRRVLHAGGRPATTRSPRRTRPCARAARPARSASPAVHDAAPGEQHRVRALLPGQSRSRPKTACGTRRAVVVLAQWNSDADGHIGLCKLLARLGIASLRISLPYHDHRMPPELTHVPTTSSRRTWGARCRCAARR